MKKILFICKYPTILSENLATKLSGQMNACKKLGYDVYYIEWNGSSFSLVSKSDNTKRKILITYSNWNLEKYYHSLFFIDLYRSIEKITKEINFDFFYIRNMPFFPPLNKALMRISTHAEIVLEMPTYPIRQELISIGRFRRLVFKVTERYKMKIYANVSLFTVCGKQVNGKLYGKSAINIYNGIDVNLVPLRIPDIKCDEINILLLASMSYWQGFDRMLYSLKQYVGNKKIILHFVGNDGDGSLQKWENLASELEIEDKVVFHKALYQKDLDNMFNKCDIGIGCLGLYRKESNDGAVLKVREYMSRGLPFVYAGYDKALENAQEFVMQVSNDDSLIEMEKIIRFAEKYKTMSDIPEKMRKYAMKYMSWENEFKKIFNKLEDNKAIS
jgi:hypothetical protein